MPVLPTHAAAPPGIRLPGSDGLYTSILTGLAFATGAAVIVYNYYQSRVRMLSQGRGRTVLTRPVVVVTNTIAVVLLINTLLCAFAPMHPVTIEVPTNLGIVTRHVHTPGTWEAVAIAVLAQGALTINSLYTWFIYQLGCQLSNVTLPAWKIGLIQAYIWGIDTLPFLGYSISNQVRMRTKVFHVVPDSNPGFTWMLVAFTITAFVLHVILNVFMVFRFIRGIKTLAQHTHILKEERVAELHSLSVKSTVYIVLSLVLYVYIFGCLMIYPVNLYLSQITTPFHLSLLLALHLCFNTKLPFSASSFIRWPLPPAPNQQQQQPPQPCPPEGEEERAYDGDDENPQQRRQNQTPAAADGGGGAPSSSSAHSPDDSAGAAVASSPSSSPSRRRKRRRGGEPEQQQQQQQLLHLSPLERGGGGASPISPKSPGWQLFGSRRQRQKRMVAQTRMINNNNGGGHINNANNNNNNSSSSGDNNRNWRPWRLPELSRVFSNPWEMEKGVVFRISETPSKFTTPAFATPGTAASAGGGAVLHDGQPVVAAPSVGSSGGGGVGGAEAGAGASQPSRASPSHLESSSASSGACPRTTASLSAGTYDGGESSVGTDSVSLVVLASPPGSDAGRSPSEGGGVVAHVSP